VCTALLRAAKLFRALKVVSLTREELINNKPDPLLATKSERAALGDVHAFMSHSCESPPLAPTHGRQHMHGSRAAHGLHLNQRFSRG
jgi:hypothetical protein